MTIARPAFAAMCAPSTGMRVEMRRPSGPSSSKAVCACVSSVTVTVQSAASLPARAMETVGTPASASTREPQAVSSDTTARRERSGWNSTALAA